MTDKAKTKGLRPLSLTNPLAALLPVTGAGNRIYRAEEATAPAEAQTLLLLNPATESTSLAVGSASQFMPVILPLDLSAALSADKTAAEPQSAVLPGGGGGVLVGPLLAPLTGLLHALTTNPPDKGGQGGFLGTAPKPFPTPPTPLIRGSLAEPLLALAQEAQETQPPRYEVAFQTGPALSVPLNLNQDDVVNPQDAQVLYYLALPQAPANLDALLSRLSGTTLSQTRLDDLTSLDLTTLIPDLNNDNRTDLQDVRVLYYALRFEDILRASPSLRETLLGDLTTEDNDLSADGRQQVYTRLLERVADLFPVVTSGDRAIEVDTGASYTLTTTDLSARDPDNANLALSWTVTTAPMNGRLELSGAAGVAIDVGMGFTQAQLEAGEVFYVHTGGNDDMRDNFAVRLQNPDDPEGTVRPTVPLRVTLSPPTDAAPTEVTLTATETSLREDVTARTLVANIGVTDAGPRGLQLVGPDADLFELNDDQDMLFLSAGAVLDFETNPTLDVSVQVIGSDPAINAPLRIMVTNVDEPPTGVTLTATETSLREDVTARTLVANIGVTDADDGPRGLELVGPDADLFELNDDQDMLFLSAGAGLDFETNRILDVSVQVIGSSPAINAPLRIMVTNVDEPPTGVTLTATETALAEDVTARTLVANIGVTDADDGPRGLQLVGPDADLFELNDDQDMLFLSAGAVLDFETNPTLDVSVQVIGSDPAINAPLRIMVTNVDEPPTGVTLTATETSLREDVTARTPVANIAVDDDDGGPRGLQLVGPDADLFELNDDQDMLFLSAGAVLDFETNPTLDVSVQVIGSDPAINAPLRIMVTNVDEPPTGVTLTATETSLREDVTAPTLVANIGVTDADDGPRGLELVGPDADLFELNDDQDMLFLSAGAVLDFETNPTLDVSVQVIGSSPAINAPLRIMVTNVDEPPTGVTLTATETALAEDVTARTLVANIGVTDADDGPRGLQLVGPDADLFELNDDQNQLFLRADAGLDFETTPTLEVSVRVVADTTVAATLQITVTDVNEAPTTGGDRAFAVVEGASYVLTVADLAATDVDAGDDVAALLTWTVLAGGPTNGRLALSSDLGTAIPSFTQRQLEDGQVVYVHPPGNDTTLDSFMVRVEDDEGSQADPVTVNVNIVGMLGSIDLTELSTGDGFIIQGDESGDRAGESVSGAGDVNGDGFADFIIGAQYNAPEFGVGGNAGQAYVVFGSRDATNRQVVDLTNLDAGDGFIIQGELGFRYDSAGYSIPGSRVGESVSGAGDVNGDGFADLIVGARYGGEGSDIIPGEAYVVFGKASGFGSPDGGGRSVIALSSLAAGEGFIIRGNTGGYAAGDSVSGAGDVNGDGYADLIVGAPRGDDGGEAYIVFGKASGFGSPDVSGRPVVDLTNLAAADGFIIRGDMANDGAGNSVSGAGDVNGDGYADLIIGAPGGDDGGNNAGEAYVVFGKQDNFGSVEGSGRVIELSSLSAADGFVIQGDTDNDQAGRRQISGAGDVNGDGYADLIVGARFADVTTSDRNTRDNAGEAYVVFGKASDFGNPDGANRQVIDLSSLTSGDGFIIQGARAGDEAGYSVSAAGDVNGDGFADLIVGARFADVNILDGDDRVDAGEAYLVFGKASGFGSVIDLESLTPADGFIIQGDAPGDYAGGSVSGAGDVNGDGYADLIVGAHEGDDAGIIAGQAYVLFGGPAGLSTETLAGDDVLSDDDDDGVVLAGPGDDVLNIDSFTDTDLLRFDGGSGTDTLRLVNPDATTDLSLDLSTLRDTRLSSIERIDLNGSGPGGSNNSLTLTRLDLLNLSEVRIDGRAELRVDGNAGDRVTVTDDDVGWVRGDDQTIEGNTYTVFNNGNARLLVNTALTLGENLMPPPATSSATMPTMAEVLQQYATGQTVDIRAFIDDLPPEDEEQKRKRLEDELAMLGPLPAAKAAMDLAEPAAVAEPEADLFELPPLIPDDG